eukprot:scaffold1903_cov396-Prasinococcus_capsulatus_cf.AAC.13
MVSGARPPLGGPQRPENGPAEVPFGACFVAARAPAMRWAAEQPAGAPRLGRPPSRRLLACSTRRAHAAAHHAHATGRVRAPRGCPLERARRAAVRRV